MSTKRWIKFLNLFVIFLMLFSPMMQGVTSVTAQSRAGGVVEQDGAVSTGMDDGVSSISFAHTSGTGEDRLMLVGVSWNSGSNAHPITTAYFNDGSSDIPLAVVISETVTATSGSTGPRYAAILSLLAPPSGAAGTVTINFDGTVQYGIVATAVNFRGVDQTTPLGTAQGANGGTSDSPTLTLSGLNGDELVFDTAFLGGSSESSYQLAVGAGQTQLWNVFNSYARAAGSIEQAAGSSVTMSWTASTTNWWALAAVPINPTSAVSSVEASAIPSDEVPVVGDTITVTININMSGMLIPDNYLGSFTSSLAWNPAVLSYNSDSGVLADYTGAINPGSDIITFNGAKTSGETGSFDVFIITFDVVGEGDAGLDLNFSAMAADTDENILPYLTVNEGSVIADPMIIEVVPDGAASSNAADDVSSISFSHTTGTGSNRLTLVGISWNSGTAERNIESVTFSYGAGPTTLDFVEVIDAQASSARNSAIYKSDGEPPAGEAGSVTITFSGSVSNGIVAGAANFANVDQGTPLGTPGLVTATSSANPSLTLTGLAGDELVFDNLFQGASSESQTITVDGGQTELWNGWAGNTRGGASYEQATSSSVTMSWTVGSASVYVLTAVPIHPAPIPVQHTITASAGANGSIAPSGAVLVDEGSNQSFLITPAGGFEVADVLVDGSSVGAVSSYEFVDVTADHTIAASFRAIQHTITASAGENGSILPSGIVLVNEGDDQSFSITPSGGYQIEDVLVDGSSVGAVSSYEFVDVVANHTISASFSELPPDQYTITASAGANGSILPSGPVLVDEGSNQSFSITPAGGFEVADVLVDGSSVGAVTSYEFINVTANHTIEVSFQAIQHTITASAGANGSILPSGAVLVNEGDDQSFSITPSGGYLIEDVLVDGISVGAVSSYEFTDVVADHTISASFIEDVAEIVTASANISDATPDVGDSITVTINIDMTNMDAPDNLLGAFTSSLSWNPAILSYDSNSGLLNGFTGAINPGSGLIQFNGAKATGVGGSIDVFTVTFNVIGAGDAALNLGFTAMAADTGNSIMDHLTIQQGSVIAEGVAGVVEMISSSHGIGDDTDVMSFSHTTGTGANRLMLVGISWNSGDAAENIESVIFSYDSTNLPLTEVITEQATVSGSTSGPRFAAIYSLVNPPSGQAGTITITFDDVVSNGVVAGAATFKGVNQSVPLGTPAGENGGTSSDPSVTLTGLSGNELVFDNVFLGGSDDGYTLSVGADQTQLWNDFDTNARGTASTEQATGSSVTMSWTPSTQNWWAQVAVPINPALGGVTYYDLSISVDPVSSGTTNPAVGSHAYEENALVTITPSPASGYEFVEWSGDCTGSGTCQITMTGDKSVTAHFAQITHQLSISVDPALGGTTNPAVGDHVYAEGASVPVTAISNEGYIFDHWSGDCTGNGACSVLMNADKSVTAHFVELVPGTIIYIGDIGSGSIKEISPTLTITTTDGVLEGDDILVGYVTGPNPTLEITVTDSVGNTYEQVELSRNYEYGRVYLFAAYDVDALPAASEIVITATIDPEGSYDYPEARAAVVSVFRGLADVDPLDQSLGNPVFEDEVSNEASATPFVGPTGTTTQADELVVGLIGTLGPVGDTAGTWDYGLTDLQRAGTTGGDADSNWTISMGYRSVSAINQYTAQKSGVTSRRFAAVIATFKADLVPEYTLNISADPAAGGTLIPGVGSHDYDEGSIVDIVAYPATGYAFAEWTGDCTGSGACQVTMNADKSVTAHFVPVQHTLSIAVEPVGAGTTTPAVGDHLYDYGAEVEVLPLANTGYEFAYWSGDCTGTGACDLTMNDDMSVVAHFTQTTFNLTVINDPVEGGTTVPSAGVHPYLENSQVAVTAEAAAGYEFDHWSGACTGTGSCSVMMDSNKTVTAHFEPIMYDLTVHIDPAGGGTTSPAEGVHAYVINSEVSISAIPASDYLFLEWTGDCTGSGVCELTMTGDMDVTAHFVLKTFDLTIEVEPAASGTTDPAVGSHTYDIGTVVPIVPTPASGYEFAYWSGDCTGTGACEVTISEDMHVMAHFAHKTYDLMIVADPVEGGTTNPAPGLHPYLEGTPVVVLAEPASGYEFDSWSGDCNGTGACSVTMDGDKTVTANFRAIMYDLTVNVNPDGGGTTSPAEGVHSYAIGTPVSVTADPAAHYLFVEWTGDCTGTGACDLTMDGAKEVTANFALEEFDLTLSVDPASSGTLDPAIGTHSYAYGSVVDVIPTPAQGYQFAYWTGDCSGTGSCQVTIDGDTNVQAHFMTATYDLTIIVDPAGGGTTSPSEGVHPYLYGTEVNIIPTAAENYVFVSWSGDCTGAGTCSLVMDGDKTVTAHFEEPKECYPLTITSSGYGALPIADPPNSDGCSLGQYEPGTSINLSAAPDEGWHIDSWYGTIDDGSKGDENALLMPSSAYEVGVKYMIYNFMPIITGGK